MNTYFLEEKFIKKIDKDYFYEAKKTALIAVINMMDVCISLDNAEEPTKPDKETYLKLLFTNQKQNEGV